MACCAAAAFFLSQIVLALLVAGTATAWTAYSTPVGNAEERDLWSLAMDSICTSGSVEESRGRLNNWIEGNPK